MRTAALVLAFILSVFIAIDVLSSWFGMFTETSSNAKAFLFVVALVMGGLSLLDLSHLWTGSLTLPVVLLTTATTLVVWYVTSEGTAAAKRAIHSEEKRSTDSGNQMRAVEKNLGIGN